MTHKETLEKAKWPPQHHCWHLQCSAKPQGQGASCATFVTSPLAGQPVGWALRVLGTLVAAVTLGVDPSLPSRPRAQSHDMNPRPPDGPAVQRPLHLFKPSSCTLHSMASLITYSRSHILPYLMKRKIQEEKKKGDLGKLN